MPKRLGEEDGSEDDAEVVDERRDGLVEEDLADEEARAEDSADEEEERAGEDDAGEAGAEERALGGEFGEGDAGVEGGEELGDQDGDGEDDHHGVEDDGERAVCALFVAGVAVAVEDGDEGDGGYSADEEVAEHVGELEGGVVGVGGLAGAEDVVDVFCADEAEDSGEEGGGHDEEGGGEGGVRVGETQPVEPACWCWAGVGLGSWCGQGVC